MDLPGHVISLLTFFFSFFFVCEDLDCETTLDIRVCDGDEPVYLQKREEGEKSVVYATYCVIAKEKQST